MSKPAVAILWFHLVERFFFLITIYNLSGLFRLAANGSFFFRPGVFASCSEGGIPR